jgi:hypothetical protein
MNKQFAKNVDIFLKIVNTDSDDSHLINTLALNEVKSFNYITSELRLPLPIMQMRLI